MLADLLLAASILGALVPLCEIYLSLAQKQQLYDGVVRFWNYIDDLGKISYIRLLSRKKNLLCMILIVGAMMFIASNAAFYIQLENAFARIYPSELMLLLHIVACVFAAFMFAVSASLSYFLLRRLISLMNRRKIIIQTMLVVFTFIGVSSLNVTYGKLASESILRSTSHIVIMSAAAIVEGTFTQITVYLTFLLALPLILLATTSKITKLLASAVAKTAECPKGIAFVISAIIGACAALLKAFAPA